MISVGCFSKTSGFLFINARESVNAVLNLEIILTLSTAVRLSNGSVFVKTLLELEVRPHLITQPLDAFLEPLVPPPQQCDLCVQLCLRHRPATRHTHVSTGICPPQLWRRPRHSRHMRHRLTHIPPRRHILRLCPYTVLRHPTQIVLLHFASLHRLGFLLIHFSQNGFVSRQGHE
jgi:hypothetical protein